MVTQLIDLPAELVDNILCRLSTADIIALKRASVAIDHRVSYTLFNSQQSLNQTMLWAVDVGDVGIIQEAVSNGACPSIILYGYEWIEEGESLEEVSTLTMATYRGHAEAFDALLKLGARPVDEGDGRKTLDNHLMKPEASALLRRLLEAGLGTELWREELDAKLVQLIVQDAPFEILRLMVENGADVNAVVPDPAVSGDLATPLSAAIRMGSTKVVEFLMEKGASVHAPVKCPGIQESQTQAFVYCRPDHIPIYAAATYAGKTGDMSFLETCLQNGADINLLAPALPPVLGGHINGHFTMTPLLRYLEAVQDWTLNRSTPPMEGVLYLLDHGAQVDLTDGRDKDEYEWMPRRLQWRTYSTMSAPGILLYKWNLKQLKHPRFFEMIQFLVQRGGGLVHAAELLMEFSEDSKLADYPMARTNPNHPDQVLEWWDIVHLVIDKLQEANPHNLQWLCVTRLTVVAHLWTRALDQDTKDYLLRHLVEFNAKFMENYGTLKRLILDRLIAQGADINSRSTETGEPILHSVCRKLHDAYAGDEEWARSKWRNNMMGDKAAEFCLSLVDKGADPYLEVEGRTAVEILRGVGEVLPSVAADYLNTIAKTIKQGRRHYLEAGPTPNTDVYRADISKYEVPADKWDEHNQFRYHRFAAEMAWNR